MFSARFQLWLLSFTGFAVNYMVRVNLNIAIVAMARPANIELQDQGEGNEINEAFCQKITNHTQHQYEQGLVLGSFYWCHWSTQVAGGVLAQRYGTRRVMGLSQLITSLLALVVPFAAKLGYRSLVALRVLQGIASGFVWPSMHTMVGRWVPPTERSKFVTAYLGSSLGAALTFPGCGLLLAWLGWEAVFYVTGLLGVLWFFVWWMLTLRTPWRHIFFSRAFWICVLARWGGDWGLFTLLAHAPTYLNHIHGLGFRMTGLIAGVPHLCRLLFALLVSLIADKLLVSGRCNHTRVRKIATAVCCLGQGVCMLGLAMAGCDASAAVLLLAAATTVNGAISTGPLASFVDISPNYAGALLGVSGMISVLPGFISPTLAGILTYQNQTPVRWRAVFLLDAGMLLVPGLIHVFCSTSEVQTWNTLHEEQDPCTTTPAVTPLVKATTKR
ncbi:hypothetical protein B566_EDAN004820 [Ephemera danica]|nr:hypothetical protein B566_EDAN004820 [Ephemera danica]